MPSLQLSAGDSSSPAEQAKSPAELGLTNFVIHISCKLLFHKRKTVHDLRNREIYEKSRNSRPQSPFFLTARVCLAEVTWVLLVFAHV